MTERLTQTPVPLKTGNSPAWQLWAQLAQFARHLQPTDWVLVGGQMVALHCHIAGITPGRATTDIDIVANVLVNPDALFACRAAASALDLTAQPSANNHRQHRFRNDSLVLDVMVPDHLPKHLSLRLAGRDPVPIEGGRCSGLRSAQSVRRPARRSCRSPICKALSSSRLAPTLRTAVTVLGTSSTLRNCARRFTTR